MNKDNFGKILCLGGIAVAGAGLAGGYLSRFWIELDVLSHFTLHFSLAIAALAIACFAAKPLRVPVALALMAAGMIAIGSWSKLSADQLQAAANVPAGTRALNVMHFNIWGRNEQFDDIDAEIARLDPDILFLTEIGNHRQRLKTMLDRRFPYRLPDKDKSASSLLMYSKYPFTDSKLQRRRDGLSFIRGTLGAEWQRLNIVGTHLSRPPDTRAQEDEIRFVAKVVKGLTGASVVVGDFNATPHSVMLEMFQTRTGLKRVTMLPTWPATGPNLPQFAIDHIFISDGLTLAVPAIVGRFAGSDHLPVAASILVPQ
ncbi:endonuclease/exonuclease/phosphatase family protein [Anderseniella sp. Alg231-50]|uniref:endonuclease/exonuclease/phosphatase family protein n=1 Tax=Anderseniella sp. Alg231-50 TaxID=1922226 RepID=UPI00307BFC9D